MSLGLHGELLDEFLAKRLLPSEQQVLSIGFKRSLLEAEFIQGSYEKLGDLLK